MLVHVELLPLSLLALPSLPGRLLALPSLPGRLMLPEERKGSP